MTKIVGLNGKTIAGKGQNTTNRNLLEWHRQIISMGPVLRYFVGEHKIREFYNNNGIRIDTINDKLDILFTQFFEITNPDRKPGESVIVKKDEKGKNILREGVTEEQFGEAYKALMEEENRIIL